MNPMDAKDPHPSLRHWQKPKDFECAPGAVQEMGWGRLMFAHTFANLSDVSDTLLAETRGRRDIALYLRDPHVVLSLAPQHLFLDPSHTFRRNLEDWEGPSFRTGAFHIKTVESREEAKAVNAIYAARGMVRLPTDFMPDHAEDPNLLHLIAVDDTDGEVLGTVTGVDHSGVFKDPENGSSLWCLAVHPLAPHPGVGGNLVEHLLQIMKDRGREFVDLSVMHDNPEAIGLYEKLGFERVPVFCVKKKNSINEPLFAPDQAFDQLNPYAAIIAKEAMRRGIQVDVLDAGEGYLNLTHGGRNIVTRESLSELTTAVAMSRCEDKRVTSRMLSAAGLRVPRQIAATTEDENLAFLEEVGRLVVKPAKGEQGRGISVDVREPGELRDAVARAHEEGGPILLEEFVEGRDLRVVVIGHKAVAAAVREPAMVIGDGRKTVRQLIEKQSRRRAAATGGESRIPLDTETLRCVEAAGYGLEDIPPEGLHIRVRKTANLHTGGTIHDVTESVHPALITAAEETTRVLSIPVAGVDLMVPELERDTHWIIEVNERPGLANHEPQPTAERFIDLLFPRTATPETET
ncbi:MAG: N-acetylglutaminylglutamine synthetase [Verrucomicrobia bacterium]|nr:N-acetylglutaminylglutamine synthetase [Verrucomicrobiota bacterium]MCH8527781.1 N-acetylglutaminylglutamine synthetase [Kiritimatiellia bacterium]